MKSGQLNQFVLYSRLCVATTMVDISYGSAVTVTARPQKAAGRKKTVALSKEQRARATHDRGEYQKALDNQLLTWYDSCVTFAERLSADYGKPTSFYLNLMFNGGSNFPSPRKPNPYNAFINQQTKEINQGEPYKVIYNLIACTKLQQMRHQDQRNV